jgi:hypothetical protein
VAGITSLSGAAEQSLSTALGFGIGLALGAALAPEATSIGQKVWSADPSKALDAGAAAAIVAETVKDAGWGRKEAAAHGVDSDRFDAILAETLNGPAFGQLVTMLRRRTIGAPEFEHGLRKAKIEPEYDAALAELQNDRLDPAVLATAIQRGIIEDPGLLPVGPPTGAGRVPPMPIAHVDAIAEARDSGIDRERLAALTRIVGLPPAPGELLELVNRGHIDETDYLRGIAEGNTRNEWASFLLNLRRRLLTPQEYAEARLRGWISPAQATAGAALSGLEAADSELLFQLNGRPIPVHQVTTGEARGGAYSGGSGSLPEAYRRALEQGSMRPEWYDLAYANRYTLPSAFVIRSMIQGGELTAEEGHKLFLESGWPPALAEQAAAAFAKGPGKTARNLTAAELLDELQGHYLTAAEFRTRMTALGYPDAAIADLEQLADARRVKKARDSRVNRIRAAYVGHKAPLDRTTAELAQAGLPQEAQTLLLDEWEPERVANVAALTPAQVKKAYTSKLFTRDVALAALEDRGYSPADATTLLDE